MCALISRGNLYGTDQRNGELNQKWVAYLNQTGTANDLYPILIVASQTVETNRVGIHAVDNSRPVTARKAGDIPAHPLATSNQSSVSGRVFQQMEPKASVLKPISTPVGTFPSATEA